MLKFAANLTTLYGELDPLERFAAAAADGFAGVEMQFPYAFGSPEALAEARAAAGLPCVLINAPPGDWEAGERGHMALPGRTAEFRAGVDRAVAYAKALECPRIHLLSGMAPADASREDCVRAGIENLRWAAERLQGEGILALVEPLNGKDMPGYLVQTADQALELLDGAAHPNAALQYDIYHMVMNSEPVVARFHELRERIGHVQFADAPGRHEPGTGKISFATVFGAIVDSGYAGWIGAEYTPELTTAESLEWLQALRQDGVA